jgi:hypothetical protein
LAQLADTGFDLSNRPCYQKGAKDRKCQHHRDQRHCLPEHKLSHISSLLLHMIQLTPNSLAALQRKGLGQFIERGEVVYRTPDRSGIWRRFFQGPVYCAFLLYQRIEHSALSIIQIQLR